MFYKSLFYNLALISYYGPTLRKTGNVMLPCDVLSALFSNTDWKWQLPNFVTHLTQFGKLFPLNVYLDTFSQKHKRSSFWVLWWGSQKTWLVILLWILHFYIELHTSYILESGSEVIVLWLLHTAAKRQWKSTRKAENTVKKVKIKQGMSWAVCK